MIKTVVGDILDATEDIICHQVNCRGVMGAGVAKTLYTRWLSSRRHTSDIAEDLKIKMNFLVVFFL